MNPTIPRIYKANTVINCLVAVIFQRPVCVYKTVDIPIRGPAIAHNDGAFLYMLDDQRLEVRHDSATAKPKRHTKISACVSKKFYL